MPFNAVFYITKNVTLVINPMHMLLDISSWWSAMGLFEQVYWLLAIPSTLIFIVLLVMTFMGADTDDMPDADAEIDADAGIDFQFLNLKNLVGFFTLFAWSGLACIKGGLGVAPTVIISFVCGLAMMLVMATIFYFMGKLADSGTMHLKNAVNNLGEVYIPIPASRKGFGQVQMSVQGSFRTLQALTDDEEDIPVGTVVRVVEVINNQYLLVRRESKA